ncbi:unnamed protein product, partial [Mesorhabditis spiculigera]
METRDFVPSLGITERQVCAYATISAVVLLLPQAHFVWQQTVLLLVRSNRSYDLLLLLLGCFGFIQLILHSIGLVVSLTSDVLADWMLAFSSVMLATWFGTLLLLPILMLQRFVAAVTKRALRFLLQFVFGLLGLGVLILVALGVIFLLTARSTQYIAYSFSWYINTDSAFR